MRYYEGQLAAALIPRIAGFRSLRGPGSGINQLGCPMVFHGGGLSFLTMKVGTSHVHVYHLMDKCFASCMVLCSQGPAMVLRPSLYMVPTRWRSCI